MKHGAYNLWQARNDARESKNMEDPKFIALKTVADVEEWRNLQNPTTPAGVQQKDRWLPPDENWIKVTVDGHFRIADGNGRGGVVIGDHHGAFVSGACHFPPLY